MSSRFSQQFTIKIPAETTLLECDVCGARPRGLWFYPTRAFELVVPTTNALLRAPQSDWAVCDECAALIETKDLHEMVRRAIQKLPGMTPLLPEALYAGFFEARCGPPRYAETRDSDRKGNL